MLKLGKMVVVLACAGIASAQMDPDDALKAIQQREAAAATQPSDPNAEIATLKSVIADQAKQIDSLKAEIVSLKETIALAGKPSTVSPDGTATIALNVQPKSTYESRAIRERAIASFVQQSKARDATIDAFAEQNHIDPAITASLHEGDPKIGMTEDEVKLITSLTPEIESADGSLYKAQGFGQSETGWNHWKITIVNGVVTEIDKPDPYTGIFPDGTR